MAPLGACQDFLDALGQVGQQVAIQSGIAIDRLLHVGDGFIVIDFWIDADPELREVGTIDFIGDFGATNVRAEIIDPVDRSQLLAGSDRDPVHCFDTNSWLFHPMHQEIRFLELGHQFLSEHRNRNASRNEHREDETDNRPGNPNQRREQATIHRFESRCQW